MPSGRASQNCAIAAVNQNAVISVAKSRCSCGIQSDVVAVDLRVVSNAADNHANIGVAGDNIPICCCSPSDDIVVAAPDIQAVIVPCGSGACSVSPDIVASNCVAGGRDVDRILRESLQHKTTNCAVVRTGVESQAVLNRIVASDHNQRRARIAALSCPVDNDCVRDIGKNRRQ